MSDASVRKLAGSEEPLQTPVEPDAPTRKLAGAEPATPPRGAAAGAEELLQSAPLALPAIPVSLATTGLSVYAARNRNRFDRRPGLTGLRHLFEIRFFDSVSKLAVTPTNVRVIAIDKSGAETTIVLSENPEREGHFVGSFIPTTGSVWNYRVVYGVSNEVVDRGQFYVVR